MTTTTKLEDSVEFLGRALRRLDGRRHVAAATLELSLFEDLWVAQIIADPLPIPVIAHGVTCIDALHRLRDLVELLDWRRVKR